MSLDADQSKAPEQLVSVVNIANHLNDSGAPSFRYTPTDLPIRPILISLPVWS